MVRRSSARLLPLAAAAMLSPGAAPPPAVAPMTPAAILAAAPAAAWRPINPAELMVMELAGGGRVAILLAPGFAPAHVANIRTMVRAGYYDGLAVTREGTLAVNPQTLETAIPGVYAAGDIVRGASLVVWAIRDGRHAAAAIVRELTMLLKAAAE